MPRVVAKMGQISNPEISRDTQAFYAIASLYALWAAFYGNWFAALPYIESSHGVSDGVFGDYLSVAIIGAVLCVLTSPSVVDAFGSKISIGLGFVITGISMTLLSISSSDILLTLAIVIFGYGSVLLYSSLVKQGAALEQSSSHLSMGIFNAIASCGNIFGGIVGGYYLEYTSLSSWKTMLIVSAVVCVVLILSALAWLYTQEEEISLRLDTQLQERVPILTTKLEDSEAGISRNYRHVGDSSYRLKSTNKPQEADWSGLIILCVIAFLGYFVEGSIGDWGSIYLQHRWTDCGYLVGITPYLLSNVGLFAGSFLSDYLANNRFYTRYTIFQTGLSATMLGFIIVVTGYFLPLTNSALVFTILGFGLAGLGLGLLTPVWYSIAGRGIREFTVTQTVSYAITSAMCGALIEPLVLGNVSTATGSLAFSFLLEVALLLVVLVLGTQLSPTYFDMQRINAKDVPSHDYPVL